MGFANFSSKSVLAAASLLRQLDADAFQRALERQLITLAFDAHAASQSEGRLTLGLLVDLLARLYPRLALLPLGTRSADAGELVAIQASLSERARAVNPEISLLSGEPDIATAAVVVGRTPYRGSAPVLYVGSRGWSTGTSPAAPLGSGATTNPFGAGAAACFGAAGVFRMIFAESLGRPTEANGEQASTITGKAQALPDAPFWLSLLDLTSHAPPRSWDGSRHTALPDRVDIGETFLVGVGAVGSGVVWALAHTEGLTGTLHLIDGEAVELSNLQRYVITDQSSIGAKKAVLGAATMRTRAGDRDGFVVEAHPVHWAEFAARRGNYHFDRVLLALDSAEDRIAAQASLPRWVANAWTQPDNLGVSRHEFLGGQACVACLYLPQGEQKHKDALYAEALRASGQAELMEIRQLLHSRRAVGRPFLERTAARLGVPVAPIAHFAEQPLDAFYTQALCGGIVLQLGGSVGAERATEVPMAFQSALAGILLAAELVVDAAKLRERALPCRTEINLLRPLGTRLNSPAAKHPSGRCICQDDAFRRAYAAKYAPDRARSDRDALLPDL